MENEARARDYLPSLDTEPELIVPGTWVLPTFEYLRQALALERLPDNTDEQVVVGMRHSSDECARINALLNNSSCKLFVHVEMEEKRSKWVEYVRILSIKPDYNNAGYLIADCVTISHGRQPIQIGDGNKLDFYFR